MKKLFYLGLLLLVAFEAANVYFIMPMPGSQRMQSIDLAYSLYTWRWVFRVVFGGLILAGARSAHAATGWRRVAGGVTLATGALVIYVVNFKMAADRMFIAPAAVMMRDVSANVVEHKRLVVGIEINGDARAYPVNYIGYHHQVRDSAGGKPVMVSYCTVCRTGRVFEPLVDGKVETFRLVGMDHFNAMFEDHTTRSWWRQANGQAITGPLKGKVLKEIPSVQVTLATWLERHPKSLIMQPDAALSRFYSETYAYELGTSRSTLTGTDTGSWNDKSWVVGVELNGESKAYDWNRLKRERVINDVVGGAPLVIALAKDDISFSVVRKADNAPVQASQEFWHSWRTFHPATKQY